MVLGYFIVYKGKQGSEQILFGTSPPHSLLRWQSAISHPRGSAALGPRPPPPLQAFYPQMKSLGTEVSGPASGIPPVTAVMPIATLRQTCGIQGQCSRAKIWSHLEPEDNRAASSQIHACFDREIVWESSRERKNGKGKRSEEKSHRSTDSLCGEGERGMS